MFLKKKKKNYPYIVCLHLFFRLDMRKAQPRRTVRRDYKRRSTLLHVQGGRRPDTLSFRRTAGALPVHIQPRRFERMQVSESRLQSNEKRLSSVYFVGKSTRDRNCTLNNKKTNLSFRPII